MGDMTGHLKQAVIDGCIAVPATARGRQHACRSGREPQRTHPDLHCCLNGCLEGYSMARRDYGTGSVYQRARDGKWVASVEVGWTTKGTRRRRTKTAETEAKARSALRTMLRDA